MAELELPEPLRDEARAAWHRFLDRVAPFRPALHRYARRLTGNLWDAEDLVQETLLRAFATLGRIHQDVASPRAYLLRIASNLWIDTVRRRGVEAGALEAEATDTFLRRAAGAGPAVGAELRAAGATLLAQLAPQERAAALLKDVFDLSLEETAEVLGTTVGAVKSALHRARGRLREPAPTGAPRRPPPSAALVDRFIALFHAGDVAGLVALVLEHVTVEHVSCTAQYGRDAVAGERGWFRGALGGHPEWPPVFRYESQRLERQSYDGEPIVLYFRTRRGEEALEQVLRIEEEDGRIARLRDYGFCPEVVRAIGEELGLPVRTGLYRYPTPEPGRSYAR